MKNNAVAEDLYTSLEDMVHMHKNLNAEVDSLNEKAYHTPYESAHLRKLKQQRLYVKDQIAQLRFQLQIEE